MRLRRSVIGAACLAALLSALPAGALDRPDTLTQSELPLSSGMQGEYLEIPGANHYTMSNHLADAQSPLNQAILKLMKL